MMPLTKNKRRALKRLARARMEKTGENYTKARAAILAEWAAATEAKTNDQAND